jgi:hypothetical protein
LLTLTALLRQRMVHLDSGFNLVNYFSSYTILSNLFAGCVLIRSAVPRGVSKVFTDTLRTVSVVNTGGHSAASAFGTPRTLHFCDISAGVCHLCFAAWERYWVVHVPILGSCNCGRRQGRCRVRDRNAVIFGLVALRSSRLPTGAANTAPPLRKDIAQTNERTRRAPRQGRAGRKRK